MSNTKKALYHSEIEPLMDQVMALCEKHGVPMVAAFAPVESGEEGDMAIFSGWAKESDVPTQMLLASQILDTEPGGSSPFSGLLELIAERGMPASVSISKVEVQSGPAPDDLLEKIFSAMEPNPNCSCARCVAKREAAAAAAGQAKQ